MKSVLYTLKWLVVYAWILIPAQLSAQNLQLNISSNTKHLSHGENTITVTFALSNNASQSYNIVETVSNTYAWSDDFPYYNNNLTFQSGDINNDNHINPGETWITSQEMEFNLDIAESLVINAGLKLLAQDGTTEYLGDAIFLHTVGMNMDVDLDACIFYDQVNEISLISRLLIDEDAAKNPGSTTITVGGIDIVILLPATQWEARDEVIIVDLVNDGAEFDPFDPPAGIFLNQLCDQGDIDQGRNTNLVMDECEPVNTVRAPCTMEGEDDIMCEYPDWEFCAGLYIPDLADIPDNMIVKDSNGDPVDPPEILITASDAFSLWYAEEAPPGSGNYTDFTPVTVEGSDGNVDSETALLKEAIALPITIKNFKGYSSQESNMLSWTSLQEWNSSHYEIQKSVDGKMFKSIGTVVSKNNSTNSNYMFEDTNPQMGTNYYKLKLIDNDATYTYSDIIAIEFRDNNSYKISPNLVKDFFMIESINQNDETIILELMSYDGKMISKQIKNTNSRYELKGQNNGIYIYRIYSLDNKFLSTGRLAISQ